MRKPQLTIQDFGGRHSANMEATRARLIKGGSWKKQRIIVVMPAGETIPVKCAMALWNLVFPPNNGFYRFLAEGLEVGDAYSTAIEQILGNPELSKWEYVLTVEHDNYPPPDGVLKLLVAMDEHPELDAIGGLYFTKGEGGVAQIWGDPNDPVLNYRPQVPQLETVQECCGLGMGFTLFRLKMFKDSALPRPLFVTHKSATGAGTQDLMFWNNARPLGYRCAVDTRVKVGHMDAQTGEIW